MEPKLLTADRFVDSHTGCSYRYIYSDSSQDAQQQHISFA